MIVWSLATFRLFDFDDVAGQIISDSMMKWKVGTTITCGFGGCLNCSIHIVVGKLFCRKGPMWLHHRLRLHLYRHPSTVRRRRRQQQMIVEKNHPPTEDPPARREKHHEDGMAILEQGSTHRLQRISMGQTPFSTLDDLLVLVVW